MRLTILENSSHPVIPSPASGGTSDPLNLQTSNHHMPKLRQYYVYIMANQSGNVIYVGVTNNILRRAIEHRYKRNPSFTSRYNCKKLVYYEKTYSILDAIARERELKGWRRAKKLSLISKTNPKWEDYLVELD